MRVLPRRRKPGDDAMQIRHANPNHRPHSSAPSAAPSGSSKNPSGEKRSGSSRFGNWLAGVSLSLFRPPVLHRKHSQYRNTNMAGLPETLVLATRKRLIASESDPALLRRAVV